MTLSRAPLFFSTCFITTLYKFPANLLYGLRTPVPLTAPNDGRSPMAKAAAAASRAMTVAVEMVLPGVLGFWIDKRLGTWILFTILGFVFGLTLAIWHLLKMTKAVAANNSQESKSETDSSRAGREVTIS